MGMMIFIYIKVSLHLIIKVSCLFPVLNYWEDINYFMFQEPYSNILNKTLLIFLLEMKKRTTLL